MLIVKKYFSLFSLLLAPMVTFASNNFDCVGTDPFWKLSITDQKIAFSQQSTLVSTMPAVEPHPAENMNFDHIRVFRTKLDNKDAIIVIQKQSCTDDTSEDVFSYEGLFITSDKVFHGCCSKKLLLTR